MSAPDPIAGDEAPWPNLQVNTEHDLDQAAIMKLMEFFQLLDRWDHEHRENDGD